MRHLSVSTFAIEHFHEVVPAVSIDCSLHTVMVVPEIVKATHAIAHVAPLLYMAIHVLVSIWHTSNHVTALPKRVASLPLEKSVSRAFMVLTCAFSV